MKLTTTWRVLLCGVIAFTALAVTRSARADYSNTVMSMNPVMYYHLDETAPVPIADQAANLGSLGGVVNAFYSGTVNVNYVHPTTGALAGSSDGAASFVGNPGGGNAPAAGYPGNLVVPFAPGLNTIQFTAEAWLSPAELTGTIASPLNCAISSGDFAAPRAGWLVYQSAEGWNLRMYNQNGTATSVNISGGGAPVVGNWYHIAVTYNGTTAKLYVNGAEVASGTPTGYVPSTAGNFTVGARSDNYFSWNGSADEVAMYATALSPAQIQTHYQNGTNSALSANYPTQVLTDGAIGYWRLDEPAWVQPDPSTLPVATNSGSYAFAADGAYGPGMVSGVLGVPFSGFPSGNRAAHFNARAGSIAIPGQSLSTDTVTFTGWLKRQGNQSLGALIFQRDMVASDSLATGLQIWDSGGNNELRANWNSAEWGTSTGLTPPDGVWTFVAMVVTPTNTALYLGDRSVSFAVTHSAHDFSVGSILIGRDECCGVRIFNGDIDEVAVFDTALTPAQINQIYYAANVPPIILTQPQATNGVNMGAPVNLTVLATGSPTLKYQWTKNGTNFVGKTTSTLAFASTTLADSGNYAVIVTNSFGAVTSSVAVVTVTPVPASFLRAVGFPTFNPATQSGSMTQVILEFSAPLDPSAIANPANYVITDGSTPLAVTGAAFTNLNQTVLLTTAPQAQARLYTVTLNNIVDATGGTISSPTNSAQFTSWVASPAGGVLCEVYYGDAGPQTVASLTNSPSYPNDPAFTTNIYVFDTRYFYPDDSHNGYGMRMSTVFTPSASGNWRFYIRGDDDAALFINPFGPSRSGRVQVFYAPSCCAAWSVNQSAAFPMVAGQSYYIELLFKEGGGGDFGKVAASLDGVGAPATPSDNLSLDPASLNGPTVGYLFSPADVGGPLTVVGPTNLTVQVNHPATFDVSASGPEGQQITYQWKRNGVDIAGATSTSYSLYATSADNGIPFSVQVSKVGSVVTPAATLHVNPDTDSPSVVSVRGSTSLSTVVVTFSELVDPSSAQTPGNYTVSGYNVTSAVLDSTGTRVTLTFDPALPPGLVSMISISNVADRSGHTMTAVTPVLRSFVLSRGLLQYDYFGEVPLDPANISTLLSDPRYPDHPTWTSYITGFDSRLIFPDDTHDAYGSRVSGVFVAPTSGDWTFYLKSDDQSVLNLNQFGSDPSQKAQVQEETACCHAWSALPAGPYTMTAGQLYFIETAQKEGAGGDFVQVATKVSDDTSNIDQLLPIPAYMVGVLADPEGASVTITKQPANFVGVYQGTTPAQTVFAPNLTTGDGGMSVVKYGSPVGPWAYNATSKSWTNFGGAGPAACGLNTPAITITNGGGLTLTFTHRYSFEGYNTSDTTAWDGGQVRISVNGGPLVTVPASAFSANGYVAPIAGSIYPALRITPGWTNIAFVGESSGYSSRTLLTSVASLGWFNAGDTIVIQFLASWDDSSEGSEPNWEIASVQVAAGASTPQTFSSWLSANATSTLQNQANSAISYIWQCNTGSGFVDLPGTGVPVCPITIGLTNSTTSYRCIVSSPGASVTSLVATASVTLPISIAQTSTSALTVQWPLPTPLSVTSFVLERTGTLSPASWSTVDTSTYQTNATSVYVTVPLPTADVTKYYRLRRN